MSTLIATRRVVAVQQCRPGLTALIFVLTDVTSLAISCMAALSLKWGLQGNRGVAAYAHLVPALLLFIVVFAALGFYSGGSLSSPEEVRRSTLACVVISLCVAVTSAFVRQGQLPVDWTIAVAALFGIAAVPVARELVRFRYRHTPWWGYPAVVFGDQQSGARLIRTLHQQVDVGLRPIAMIATGASDVAHLYGVPVIAEEELSDLVPALKGRGYALLAGTGESRARMMNVVAANAKLFPNMLVVPEIWDFPRFCVSPKNVGGFLGLEVREEFLKPSKQFLKRMVDITLTSVLMAVAAPLVLSIAIAIKIDSAGPVLYRHRRIGRGGVEFHAWKFRSMVRDADASLTRYLAAHPELADEWKQNHKLRDDPRITRIGRFLRRSSMDEIPQLWNILRGEMSLVGPRPIVQAEVPHYGEYFDLYTRVHGGLTGLWQVSGRSDTSYEQRVGLDVFYVRNWSVWLDCYILFRTIAVLWWRAGAY